MTIEHVEIDGVILAYENLPQSNNFSLETFHTSFSGRLVAVNLDNSHFGIIDFNLLSKAISDATSYHSKDPLIKAIEESPYIYCPPNVRHSALNLINELKNVNQQFISAGLTRPKIQLKELITFLKHSTPISLGAGQHFIKDLCLVSIVEGELIFNPIY